LEQEKGKGGRWKKGGKRYKARRQGFLTGGGKGCGEEGIPKVRKWKGEKGGEGKVERA